MTGLQHPPVYTSATLIRSSIGCCHRAADIPLAEEAAENAAAAAVEEDKAAEVEAPAAPTPEPEPEVSAWDASLHVVFPQLPCPL